MVLKHGGITRRMPTPIAMSIEPESGYLSRHLVARWYRRRWCCEHMTCHRPAVVSPNPAANVSGPLSSHLRRANQPVISTRNLFATPRPSLLASAAAAGGRELSWQHRSRPRAPPACGGRGARPGRRVVGSGRSHRAGLDGQRGTRAVNTRSENHPHVCIRAGGGWALHAWRLHRRYRPGGPASY
jgi:hypothetical protein